MASPGPRAGSGGQGPTAASQGRHSLQLRQCVQVLHLPDLVVVQIQLPEAAQLLQVLDALNQVLTEAESLGTEKGPPAPTVSAEATWKRPLFWDRGSLRGGRGCSLPPVARGADLGAGGGLGPEQTYSAGGLGRGLGCVLFAGRVIPQWAGFWEMNLTE